MRKTVLKGKMVRLYPNREQTQFLIDNFGCSRFIWNKMLDMQESRYKNGGKYVDRFAMNTILTPFKKEFSWLKNAESTSLINVNQDLDAAFKKFFTKKGGHPKFKSKKHEQSFRINCVRSKGKDNIRLINDCHIQFPKLGKTRFKTKGMPNGKIKSVTIRMKPSGKFFMSILFEMEIEELPKTGNVCGCDLGLKHLATLDDGTKFPLPRFDKKSEKKLKRWKRIAARRRLKAKEAMKEDDSLHYSDFKNYQKARAMAAKYEEKIANQRNDYLHKLSIWLVKHYDVILLEDLDVKHMLHKNYKDVSRAISNAGWHNLARMIKYKCEWYGKECVQVSTYYPSSQLCFDCGNNNHRLGLNQDQWMKVREWDCPVCGKHHDRDINAAKNIRKEGLRLLSEIR